MGMEIQRPKPEGEFGEKLEKILEAKRLLKQLQVESDHNFTRGTAELGKFDKNIKKLRLMISENTFSLKDIGSNEKEMEKFGEIVFYARNPHLKK